MIEGLYVLCARWNDLRQWYFITYTYMCVWTYIYQDYDIDYDILDKYYFNYQVMLY